MALCATQSRRRWMRASLAALAIRVAVTAAPPLLTAARAPAAARQRSADSRCGCVAPAHVVLKMPAMGPLERHRAALARAVGLLGLLRETAYRTRVSGYGADPPRASSGLRPPPRLHVGVCAHLGIYLVDVWAGPCRGGR